MFIKTFVLAFASALAVNAQMSFGNSSTTSATFTGSLGGGSAGVGPTGTTPVTGTNTAITVSSYTSGAPLPSDVSAVFTLSTNLGGAFFCSDIALTFSAGASVTSGSQITLFTNGSLSCNGVPLYVGSEVASINVKRQAAATALLVGVSNANTNANTLATYFTTTFSLTGTTVVLNNGGVTYAFGLQPINGNTVLVAYNPANGVPAGVTPITLIAEIVAQQAGPTATPSSSGGAGAGAVATSTVTVTELQNNVLINVNIVIIITPLASPLVVSEVVCFNANGANYCVTQAVTISAATSTISSNGVAVPSGKIVYVSVCPLVVPATQVVGGSTVVGVLSTTGVVYATQGSGQVVSTVTVKGSAITATQGVSIAAGSAVVAAATGASSTGLPKVTVASSGSNKLVAGSALLAAAFGFLML